MRKEMLEMQQESKKLTFGIIKSMAHHRNQLERKCQEIGQMLSGRTQPLLPKGWTDEDAWKLAGALAKLMGQVKQVGQTVFDEEGSRAGTRRWPTIIPDNPASIY